MKQHPTDLVGLRGDSNLSIKRSFGVVKICLVFSLIAHGFLLSFGYRKQATTTLLQEPIKIQIPELASKQQQPPDVEQQTGRAQPRPLLSMLRGAIATPPLRSVAASNLIREDGLFRPSNGQDRSSLSPAITSDSHGEGIVGMPTGNSRTGNSRTGNSGLGTRANSTSVRCIANCNPSYPAALNGAEGSARMLVSINNDGDVIGVVLTGDSSNLALSRFAMRAATRMRFSVPEGLGSVTVPVNIFYTIRGTAFDRDTSTRIKRVVAEQKRQEDVPPSRSQGKQPVWQASPATPPTNP